MGLGSILKGAVFILVIGSLYPHMALGHAFSRSSSQWQIDAQGIVRMELVTPILAAETIPYGDPNLTPEQRFLVQMKRGVALAQDGAACALSSAKTARAMRDFLRAEMVFDCAPFSDKPLIAKINIFFDSDPSHIHFARFFWKGEIEEALFSSMRRDYKIALASQDEKTDATHKNKSFEGGALIWDYLIIGVGHILGGLDHLAFLLAIFLICGLSLSRLFWSVSGFTLGHSLTLALSAFGVLRADINMIEALIGFTVLAMALEKAGLRLRQLRFFYFCLALFLLIGLIAQTWLVSALTLPLWLGLGVFVIFWGLLTDSEARAQKYAPFLSILFGLIHGLGFASVLSEAKLGREDFLFALAGFNIGVEVGQLFFILCLCAFYWLIKRVADKRQMDDLSYTLACLLVGLGVYWFIERAFF